MSEGDNVVVAVRVRPFNEREKSRNAQLVVQMPDEQQTTISDPNAPNEDAKIFSFDHSYWSHDGFKENSNGYLEAVDSHYADQRRVFDDLGQGVLNNAWKGYNCSLFAYGQTGSGKSYSMVGDKHNRGIIPIVCEELFKRIEEGKTKNADVECQVSISMFEIYCEKVRDLLSTKPPPKGGLKVREHPKLGFYVEDLTSVPVSSFKQIEKKMDEGTKQRTIAATNMNATSSRAHTIVKLQFNQKIAKGGGGTTTKKSEINLVDLAGSERQKTAGSEGDRLKEGIVINQSLSTLGRVIKALYDQQSSKGKKNVQVPYRDSVLTSLLKNALGGNSKTIMIAALSPADVNYEETLSTLRFADRMKSIKTKAVVNESATERMIRELREENARLQELIRGGGGGAGGPAGSSGQEEVEALKRQLEQNQKEMSKLEESWQQKLDAATAKEGGVDERYQVAERRKKEPHMWNLNEDPALTDMIVHFIRKGEVSLGNKDADPPADIQLNGLSIQPQHALFVNSDNKKVTVQPLNGAEILLNGKSLRGPTQLTTNDRIHFGGNHLYVFVNPNKRGKKSDKITYDMAQQEIARNSGLSSAIADDANKSAGDLILEEDLVQLLPNVYRANSMSKELKRHVTFEIVLVAPETRGLSEGLTEIWIKVFDRAEDTHFLWEKNRFLNRYYGMQEMYQNFLEGDADWDLPKERDPFYEPPDSEVLLGSTTVFLQSLAYLIEYEEQLTLFDFCGQDLGILAVGLTPCTPSGKEILGEYVEDPKELEGKNLSFKVKILSAMGLPRRIDKSRCKYSFFNHRETCTPLIVGSNPAYAHEEAFTFRPVTNELVEYLKGGSLYVTVWGTQRGKLSLRRSAAPPHPASRRHSIQTDGERMQRVEKLLNETQKVNSQSISLKAVEKAVNGVSAELPNDAKTNKEKTGKKSSSKTRRTSKSRPAKTDDLPKEKIVLKGDETEKKKKKKPSEKRSKSATRNKASNH